MHNIERFYCLTCGYTDCCVGHPWEDETPIAKFTSFACKDCKRLSDCKHLRGEPSLLIYASTGEVLWEYIPDEPFCMWCGSKNVEEWSEDNPVCPRCGRLMQKLSESGNSI